MPRIPARAVLTGPPFSIRGFPAVVLLAAALVGCSDPAEVEGGSKDDPPEDR